MIELVALKIRATAEHDCGIILKRTTAEALAIAVLRVMREPTEAMIDAGYEPIRFTETAGHLDARRSYVAFIDAALGGEA